MRSKTLMIIAGILLLAACTPKPAVTDSMEKPVAEKAMNTETSSDKKDVVVPEDEELQDVVDDLEADLDTLDIDGTYEEVDVEDITQ